MAYQCTSVRLTCSLPRASVDCSHLCCAGALVHYGSAASGTTLTIPLLHTQPTLPAQGLRERKSCLFPRNETAAGVSFAERQTHSLKPQSPLTTPRFFQDAAPMTGRAVNMVSCTVMPLLFALDTVGQSSSPSIACPHQVVRPRSYASCSLQALKPHRCQHVVPAPL